MGSERAGKRRIKDLTFEEFWRGMPEGIKRPVGGEAVTSFESAVRIAYAQRPDDEADALVLGWILNIYERGATPEALHKVVGIVERARPKGTG